MKTERSSALARSEAGALGRSAAGTAYSPDSRAHPGDNPMRLLIPRETTRPETRVALLPDSVSRLANARHAVVLESRDGLAASFADVADLLPAAELDPA